MKNYTLTPKPRNTWYHVPRLKFENVDSQTQSKFSQHFLWRLSQCFADNVTNRFAPFLTSEFTVNMSCVDHSLTYACSALCPSRFITHPARYQPLPMFVWGFLLRCNLGIWPVILLARFSETSFFILTIWSPSANYLSLALSYYSHPRSHFMVGLFLLTPFWKRPLKMRLSVASFKTARRIF